MKMKINKLEETIKEIREDLKDIKNILDGIILR